MEQGGKDVGMGQALRVHGLQPSHFVPVLSSALQTAHLVFLSVVRGGLPMANRARGLGSNRAIGEHHGEC